MPPPEGSYIEHQIIWRLEIVCAELECRVLTHTENHSDRLDRTGPWETLRKSDPPLQTPLARHGDERLRGINAVFAASSNPRIKATGIGSTS